MALFKSTIFAAVSGSLAGTTFSRNKGGPYIRARATPTNPNTPAQIESRSSFGSLVNAWTEILTQAQRDEWDIYALNTPVTNVFGDAKNLSGQSMYIRSNQPRVRDSQAREDDGPATFDLGTFTTPTMLISEASPNDVVITFTDTDTWANAAGGFLFGLVSRGQNNSIKFFKGPFQSMGSIVGDPSPPTSPTTLTSPFAFVEDQLVFAQFRAGQDDGRLSNKQIISTVVTA